MRFPLLALLLLSLLALAATGARLPSPNGSLAVDTVTAFAFAQPLAPVLAAPIEDPPTDSPTAEDPAADDPQDDGDADATATTPAATDSEAQGLVSLSLSRDYWPDPGAVGSLADLKQQINAFLAGSAGDVGIALYQPDRGFLIDTNADVSLPLASVAKVPIMLAYLDFVHSQERQLSEDEDFLIDLMITESDNYSTDVLWEIMGGNQPLLDYLGAHNLADGVEPSPDEDWGVLLDSPRNLALLLWQLYSGPLLTDDDRELALGYLGSVDPWQRWGVTAGLEDEGEPDLAATAYLKNGSYPGDEGWRLNSAGIIVPDNGQPPYVLVILTDSVPDYDYGLETIETIARLVHQTMHAGVAAKQPVAAASAGSDLEALGGQ